MTFEDLIGALGKRLEIDIEDAGGAVAMEIDGVDVVLQDAGELLLMRAEVGELPEGGEAEILAAAMKANFLYQGTGGATLAVNPADGMLHVHKYNWMERMDAETVLDAIDKLADTASAWRKILADYTSGAVAADADHPPSLGESGFMQV